MARDLYDDHFKAVESMPRGVVVTLRNIATQLESAWELHTNRQVELNKKFYRPIEYTFVTIYFSSHLIGVKKTITMSKSLLLVSSVH